MARKLLIRYYILGFIIFTKKLFTYNILTICITSFSYQFSFNKTQKFIAQKKY